MFLHIGGGHVLPTKTIIGIFDLDNTSRGRDTLSFLQTREKDGRLVPIGDCALPRSFTVAETDGTDTVYLSPVNTETLKKRLQTPAFGREASSPVKTGTNPPAKAESI